jgi:hypothetical protein
MSNTAIIITILTIIVPLISSMDISCGDPYPPPHEGRLSFHDRGEWESTYRLWAYPAERKPGTVVHLQTSVPALVTYVLGPTWRSQLAQGDGTFLKKPTGNWSDADEAALAMRIHYAGGASIDIRAALGLWWLYETICDLEWKVVDNLRKYVFGWPGDGGVWVLPLPLRVGEKKLETDERGNIINFQDILDSITEDPDDADVFYYGGVNLSCLRSAETMDEYCEKLKELGARFYENPRDSGELLELGLLDGELVSRALQA